MVVEQHCECTATELYTLKMVLVVKWLNLLISSQLKKKKKLKAALAGVAQWIECPLVNQKGHHQFNSQSGHMPGLQARSPTGGI